MSDVLYDYTNSPPDTPFPSTDLAIDAHYGLLAVGGDWHPDRIVTAYRSGIFPWPMADLPLGWYCPPQRMIFDTAKQPLGRRFRKGLESLDWTVTADRAIESVIRACAEVPRIGQDGTWIVEDMIESYLELHRHGITHSVEVWDSQGNLIGGLFGVCVKHVFCGDSMFSLESGASKVAFAHLVRFLAENGIRWVDGQVPNAYLESLGGITVSRDEFLHLTASHGPDSALSRQSWSTDFGLRTTESIR